MLSGTGGGELVFVVWVAMLAGLNALIWRRNSTVQSFVSPDGKKGSPDSSPEMMFQKTSVHSEDNSLDSVFPCEDPGDETKLGLGKGIAALPPKHSIMSKGTSSISLSGQRAQREVGLHSFVILAFAATDILFFIERRHGESILVGDARLLGLALVSLYAVIAAVLIVAGCRDRCGGGDHLLHNAGRHRGIQGFWWFAFAMVQTCTVLVSALWRQTLEPELDVSPEEFRSSQSGAAIGLLQLLSVVLYAADFQLASLASLTSFLALLAFGVGSGAPAFGLCGGVLLLAAACFACAAVSTGGPCSVAPTRITKNHLIIQESHLENELSEIREIFSPILDEHLEASSRETGGSGKPELNTRLDKLVERLVTVRQRISSSSLDGEIADLLALAFSFVLGELKHVSSLGSAPIVSLVGESPMMVDYVQKTLLQGADASVNELMAQRRAHRISTHTSNTSDTSAIRRASFQQFVEEQTGRSREQRRSPGAHGGASPRCGTLTPPNSTPRKTTPLASLNEATESPCDTAGPSPHARAAAAAAAAASAASVAASANCDEATFDQAVGAMMAALTFSEHKDELPPPLLSSDLQELLSRDLGGWGFDVFRLSRLCDDRALAVTGGMAMRPHMDKLGIDGKRVNNFLDAIEARYHASNAYHNAKHGADVMNSMLYYLKMRNSPLLHLDPLEKLAALVAAGAHDVGHNGRANRFHVTAESPLGLLYNDQSVLENMHCTLTFAVLHSDSCNFLLPLDLQDRAAFRSIVVHAILDTDLARHVQSVSRFRTQFLLNPEPLAEGETIPIAQRRELLSFMLKASDIAGSAKPWELHLQWTLGIQTEFYSQGDAEKNLGLPCSPFCDRHASNVSESQRGFFDFIVSPLYNAVDDYFNSRRLRLEVLPEIEKNRSFWRKYDGSNFNYEDAMSNTEMLRRAFLTLSEDHVEDTALMTSTKSIRSTVSGRCETLLHRSMSVTADAAQGPGMVAAEGAGVPRHSRTNVRLRSEKRAGTAGILEISGALAVHDSAKPGLGSTG